MFHRALLCTTIGLLSTFAVGQITVTDATIEAGQTFTMEAGQEYAIDGFVFVEEDAVLNIEPGAVIKGVANPTTGDNASALIIARGGKIFANGSATAPIIFTAEADDLADPNDLGWEDRGLWGGLIILGRATTNKAGDGQIEGIPTDEPRAAYGGTDDNDNSGVLRYVSIRHGGAELNPGDEINGLTLGAVGRGTTIEYVEIFANDDDGVEWFGGTVNTRYLAVSFCGDDAYDYDEGWRGKNQFWLAVQSTDRAGRVGEHDGGTDQETAPPFSSPQVYNATYIGAGSDLIPPPQGDGDFALLFRDNAGGNYCNSIITEYTGQNGGGGINVEDLAEGADSRVRLEEGDLVIASNIWWNFADGNTLAGIAPQDFLQNHLAANNNQIVDPALASLSRVADGGLDPRPSANGAAARGAKAVADDFFKSTPYYGAFSPNGGLWTDTWTALSEYGHTPSPGGPVVINDDSIVAGQVLTLTCDNEYILDGFVFVEDGAILIIEPGTVIRGMEVPTTGDNASALIIARGGQIYANGTAQHPIVFTAEMDDLNNPSDLSWEDRGLWGGLILLGRATTNKAGDGQIEGIPTDEPRAAYGGTNDADNSGSLRYVSIRHAGAELNPGDEINGLTLGAVGSGTSISYVEVFANDDDGFEWFGGTVNTKYLVAAFCGDDAFDYDEGWRGKNQFWFAIQATDRAGRVGEHDGGTDQETAPPFSNPAIYNATYIGAGTDLLPPPEGDGDNALLFCDNAGGSYANSIITEYNGQNGGAGINVEDLGQGADSRVRLEEGDLVIANNIWWDFADGNTLDAIAPQDFVREHVAANNNRVMDPQLRSISRIQDNHLDPRPAAGSPASGGAVAPADKCFDKVSYYGAFDPHKGLWTDYWTALYQENHTARSGNNRWITHVTRLGGDFTSEVFIQNQGTASANVLLKPYLMDGTGADAVTVNVPGNSSWSAPTTDVFGDNLDVSHFSIDAAKSARVSIGYKANTGTGGTGHVNETSQGGRSFTIYPGEQNLVFDGLAVVNLGSEDAEVTVTYLDASGGVTSTQTVSDSLAPGAKALASFDTLVSGTGGSVRLEATEAVSVLFLRGSRNGDFLYQTNPVGN